MAYIDFREAELSGSPQAVLARAPAPAKPSATFAPLEWQVIALAQHDTVRSLRRPGRFGRALARLFGARVQAPLADPRLEALRRLAVFAWRDSFNVPRSELSNFHDAGFSADHAELLLESVLGARGRQAGKAMRQASALVQCSKVRQTDLS